MQTFILLLALWNPTLSNLARGESRHALQALPHQIAQTVVGIDPANIASNYDPLTSIYTTDRTYLVLGGEVFWKRKGEAWRKIKTEFPKGVQAIALAGHFDPRGEPPCDVLHMIGSDGKLYTAAIVRKDPNNPDFAFAQDLFHPAKELPNGAKFAAIERAPGEDFSKNYASAVYLAADTNGTLYQTSVYRRSDLLDWSRTSQLPANAFSKGGAVQIKSLAAHNAVGPEGKSMVGTYVVTADGKIWRVDRSGSQENRVVLSGEQIRGGVRSVHLVPNTQFMFAIGMDNKIYQRKIEGHKEELKWAPLKVDNFPRTPTGISFGQTTKTDRFGKDQPVSFLLVSGTDDEVKALVLDEK